MAWAIEERSYSQRRACALVGLQPRTYRYASRRPDDAEVRRRLHELAAIRRRFGYRRLHILLHVRASRSITRSCSASIARNG